MAWPSVAEAEAATSSSKLVTLLVVAARTPTAPTEALSAFGAPIASSTIRASSSV